MPLYWRVGFRADHGVFVRSQEHPRRPPDAEIDHALLCALQSWPVARATQALARQHASAD
jgi:hypothetical protein